MNAVRKTLMSVLLTGGVTTGLVGTAFYTGVIGAPHRAVADDHDKDHHDDDVNYMHTAIDLLTQAKTSVDASKRDFDGHRDAASKAISAAMDEIHAGLGDARHDDHHDDHKDDHR